MSRSCLIIGVSAAVLSCCSPAGRAQQTAVGFVFHDLNDNGRRDPGEPGLPGVRVSNGRQVVGTDAAGRYELPVDDDTILFVIKPSGWMTPIDELNLPRFYYIHKPGGSPKLKYPGVPPTGPLPESVDFPLRPQAEPQRFSVIFFGDTQPADMQDIAHLAHDVVEPLIGTDAAFGMTLGDLVHDKLELHASLNEVIAQIGVPWYNVPGNHDMDYSAATDRHADENWELTYGPPYYSFDYGPVHFVVLDDIIWHGATPERKGHYVAGLGEEQLEFVRNDLALVPEDRLVVLTMHIPITEIAERKELLALVARHRYTLSLSAHTHIQEHLFLDADDGWPGREPHHHANCVTACGSWWRGAPDEFGIPHTAMADGTPNGWTLATFDGHDYELTYVPARRPAEFQMSIYCPDSVPADKVGETEVLANVFAGSRRSTVEMRVDAGPWVALKQEPREDPYYAAIKRAEEGNTPPPGRKLPRITTCPHLWVGRLPEGLAVGAHVIEVRTTDLFGRRWHGRRIVRIE